MAENSKFRSVEVVGIQVLQLTKLVSKHNDSTVGNESTLKKSSIVLFYQSAITLPMKLESR